MEFNSGGTLRVVNKTLNVDYESASHNGSWNLRLHGICNKGDILQVVYSNAKLNNSASMVILY